MSDRREAAEDVEEELDTTEEAETAETETEEAEGEEPEGEAEEEGEGEADDAEGGTDGEAEVEDEPVRAKPLSRAERRIQSLDGRLKTEREARERIERELDDIKRGRQTGPSAEQLAAERERVALMDPAERTAYEVGKVRDEMRGELGKTQLMLAAAADKTEFAALCARHPHYERMRDEVEDRVQAEAKKGIFVNRLTVARYLVGEMAEKRAAGNATRERKRTQQVQRRETAKPGGRGRSDMAARGGKQPKSAKDKLDGVTF